MRSVDFVPLEVGTIRLYRNYHQKVQDLLLMGDI